MLLENEDNSIILLLELLKSVNKKRLLPPNSIELHLTNACNHNCSWCVADEVRQNPWHFKYRDAENLIYQFAKEGVKLLVFSGGGDPMVFKGIENLLYLSKKLGITNHMITNGAGITNKNVYEVAKYCDRIRLSIDAGSIETHTKIHRPGNTKYDNYYTIINNMKLLIEKMEEFNHYLLATFIVIEENKHELQMFIDHMESIGLKEIEFKTNHLYSMEQKLEIYYYIEKILYSNKNRDIKLSVEYPKIRNNKNKINSYNYMGWINGVVEANGDMYPCCHTTLQKNWLMGNVIESNFAEIWYGEKRSIILKKMNESIFCPTCIDYDINKRLHEINIKLLK